MSTAFERLISITKYTGSTAGTHYTVPAGRYARVTIQGATFTNGDSLVIGGGTLGSTVVSNYPNDPGMGQDSAYLSKTHVITASETISTVNTATVAFVVEEYNAP